MTQHLLRHFSEESTSKGARSTALHSLQWGLGLLLTGITSTILAGCPSWLTMLLSVLLIVVIFVFLGAYIFLLMNNPDALRSENFSLSKMAIEKGLTGDSTTGLLEAPNSGQQILTSSSSSEEGGR